MNWKFWNAKRKVWYQNNDDSKLGRKAAREIDDAIELHNIDREIKQAYDKDILGKKLKGGKR